MICANSRLVVLCQKSQKRNQLAEVDAPDIIVLVKNLLVGEHKPLLNIVVSLLPSDSLRPDALFFVLDLDCCVILFLPEAELNS